MKAGHIVKNKGLKCIYTTENELLTAAAALMCEHRIGSLVVMDKEGQNLRSIVTERDLLYVVGRNHGDISSIKVCDVMAKELITCSVDDTLDDVMDLMMNNSTGKRIRHLPVLDEGKLAGIISISDVVDALLTKVEFENKLLKSYIKNWPDADGV